MYRHYMESEDKITEGVEYKVVGASELQQATQEGWCLVRPLEEEEPTVVHNQIPNPEFIPEGVDNYGNIRYAQGTPTILVTHHVTTKTSRFLISLKRSGDQFAFKEKQEELDRMQVELKEALRKQAELGEELKAALSEKKRTLQDAQAKVEKAHKDLNTLQETHTNTVDRERELLDIFARIWAQFGNREMKQVLGDRYLDEFDSMSSQSQAKAVWDHLLND